LYDIFISLYFKECLKFFFIYMYEYAFQNGNFLGKKLILIVYN